MIKDLLTFGWIATVAGMLVWWLPALCVPRLRDDQVTETRFERGVGQGLRGLALLMGMGGLAASFFLFGLPVLLVGWALIGFWWRRSASQPLLGETSSFFALWEVIRTPTAWTRAASRFRRHIATTFSNPSGWQIPPATTGIFVCTTILFCLFALIRFEMPLQTPRLPRSECYELLLQAKYIRLNTISPDRTGGGLASLTALLSLLAACDMLQVVRLIGALMPLGLGLAVLYVIQQATQQRLAGFVSASLIITGSFTFPIPGMWQHLPWPPEPAVALGLKVFSACNEAIGRQMSALPLEAALVCALLTLPNFWKGSTPNRVWDGLAGLFMTTLIHPGVGFFLGICGVCFSFWTVWQRSIQAKRGFVVAMLQIWVLICGHGMWWLFLQKTLKPKLVFFSWLAGTPELPVGTMPAVAWSWTGVIGVFQMSPVIVALVGMVFVTLILMAGASLIQKTELQNPTFKPQPSKVLVVLGGWTVLAFWTAADARQTPPQWSIEALAVWPVAVACLIGLGIGALGRWIEAAFPQLFRSELISTGVTALLCISLFGMMIWRGSFPLFHEEHGQVRFWCGSSSQDGGVQYLEYDRALSLVMDLQSRFPANRWMLVAPGEQFVECYGQGWHYDLSEWVRRFTPDQVRPQTFQFPFEVPDLFILVEKRPWVVGEPNPNAMIAFAQHTDITYREYRSAAGRSSLMQTAMTTLRTYAENHRDLSVYFEDDTLVLFQLHTDKADLKPSRQ